MTKYKFILIIVLTSLFLFGVKGNIFAECGFPLSQCESEIGAPSDNYCCRRGEGCSYEGLNLNQWDYAYVDDCCADVEMVYVVDPGNLSEDDEPYECHYDEDLIYYDEYTEEYVEGGYVCYLYWNHNYRYEKRVCGATDTCKSTPYLYAGLCSDTGCTVGGRYKVCCNADGTVDGNCNGGEFTGTCQVGTITKFCGWGGYPDCDAPDVCGGAPPPTPGPGTPTPTPTSPPPPPGEGRISVNISGVVLEVGAQVTIEVYQEPKRSDDSACYYREIEVKMNNPGGTLLPPDFVVCKAGNFQNRSASNECDWGGDDGRCRTCIWDTNNIQAASDSRAKDFPVRQYPTEPSERYVANVYYGGHGEDPCTDGADSDTDEAFLKGESVEYFDPEEGCPEGTSEVEIPITDVDPHFNSLSGWDKRQGDPGAGGGYFDCCYRSRGSRCDEWGHCGTVQAFDGNMLRDFSDDCDPKPYIVSTRLSIPPETVGDEYLVSVMGTGIKSERTGPGDDDGKSRPFMKLGSGDLSTVFYQFSKDCSWREGTYKMLAREPWIEVYLRSNTTDKTNGRQPVQSAFDNLKLYHCEVPTCTVSGLTTVNVNTPATYCATTTNAPEGVEIWQSPTTDQTWTNVRPKSGDGCNQTSFTSTGTYYVVCNAFASDVAKCSGNPWCPWPPEALPEAPCGGWADCTANDVLTVTVTAADPWFQTKGGDVHGEGGVRSPIPSGCKDDPDCEPYLNLALDGVNGVVSSGDSIDISPGGEQVGEINDWWVEGESVDLSGYGYDYFDSLIDQDDGDPVLSDGKPGTSGIYKISGDQTISNAWNVAIDETFVILISSNLTIEHNIDVREGGFLAFIVNGDIEIKEGVNKLEGIYIANGNIITSGESDNQLKAEGMFIGLTGVSLDREFKDEGLNTQPVELFTHRPDLFINAPDELKKPRFTWQEVAP